MREGPYSVYRYDRSSRQTVGDPIVSGVDLRSADEKAAELSSMESMENGEPWRRIRAGENCVFKIGSQDLGYIVIKRGIGSGYMPPHSSESENY